MKHIIIAKSWQYSEDPFPAFRCFLGYGRNKKDFGFLPSTVPPDEDGKLPDGKFRVIKTREKGTTMIVPGNEASNRILLFAGECGGFRGGVSVVAGDTTAQILKEVSAGNACSSEVAVIALLAHGEKLVFHSYGRRTNCFYVYENREGEIRKLVFEKGEYVFSQDRSEGEEI